MHNQFFTIFATILCAQSGLAAELNTLEDEQVCWPKIDGTENCADERPSFDEVPASCCYFYTGTTFSGDFFEVCATDFYKEGFVDVPLEFFHKGIDSWACGENTELLIEEVEERDREVCPYADSSSSSKNWDDRECLYDRTNNSFTS